jgi:hypothetical protein
MLGDEIVKFGSVEIATRFFFFLESHSNEDTQLSLLIIPHISSMIWTIISRNQHGRGLMGYALLNLCISCSIGLLAYWIGSLFLLVL